MTKLTKKDMYSRIAAAMADDVDVVAFCEKEIAALDKKAAAAKAKAAEKREAGDELQARILDTLTEDWMSIADVVAALDDGNGDITNSKVIYRLNQLVASSKIEKTDAKLPATDGSKARTIKVFRIAQ